MAERFLRGMSVPPTGRSITTCMDAWTQQGVAGTGKSRPDRAHALLKETWPKWTLLASSPPNTTDSGPRNDPASVIAWIVMDTNQKINQQEPRPYSAPLVAHTFLKEMKAIHEAQWEALASKEYRSTGRVKVKPACILNATVVHAYAVSNACFPNT